MKTTVVPWSIRYRLGAPLAASIAALFLFVTGLLSSDVRTDPSFRPILWGLLATGVVFAAMTVATRRIFGARLIVDERGVRLGGRRPVDLGLPDRVAHGRFEELVVYGRGALRRRMTPYLWCSVAAGDGRTVVFRRAMRAFAELPPWPASRPPAGVEQFDCAGADIVELRTSIGRLIR